MNKIQSLGLDEESTRSTFAAPVNMIAYVFGMLAEAKSRAEPWSRTILDDEGWTFVAEKLPEFTAPQDVWCVTLYKWAEEKEGEERTRNVFVLGGWPEESHARVAAGIFQATLDVLRQNPQFAAEFDQAWHESDDEDGEGGAGGSKPMLD